MENWENKTWHFSRGLFKNRLERVKVKASTPPRDQRVKTIDKINIDRAPLLPQYPSLPLSLSETDYLSPSCLIAKQISHPLLPHPKKTTFFPFTTPLFPPFADKLYNTKFPLSHLSSPALPPFVNQTFFIAMDSSPKVYGRLGIIEALLDMAMQ